MRLVFAAVLLVCGCSEDNLRDATAAEVRLAAEKCRVIVSEFGPTIMQGELIPKVALSIDNLGDEQFVEKGSCLRRELRAVGADSLIHGSDGQDLL